MYPVGVIAVIEVILVVWLAVVSYWTLKERRYLKKMFPRDSGRDVRGRLIEDTEVNSLGHVQKIRVIRYNPYDDTGGDQSFSLLLLDGRSSGCIVTSLHSRAGTRVYIKPVVEGKSELELSKEERDLLKKA